MLWKKKPKEPEFAEPTQEEVEAAFEKGVECITAIIDNSENDAVHFLQIHLTGMETVGLLYGRSEDTGYIYNDLNEFLVRAGFRISVVKSCLITLSTFSNQDGKNPTPEIFETVTSPDSAYGWMVQGDDYVPLTGTQTFGFFYESEMDDIADKSLKEAYELKNGVAYKDAWVLK